MNAEWIIWATAERVDLNESNEGTAAFTVTNRSAAPDQVVFEALPGEGVNRSWFSVDRPQRFVEAGASVSYLARIAAPAGTPAATYWMQGRVYSAGSAPDEGSQQSGRVMFDVRPSAKPSHATWPYAVAAALVAVVLGALGWVFLGRGDSQAQPQTSPSPTPSVSPKPSFSPGPIIIIDPTGASPSPSATRNLMPHFDLAAKPIRTDTLTLPQDHYVDFENAAVVSGTKGGDLAFHNMVTFPLTSRLNLEPQGEVKAAYLGVVAKLGLSACAASHPTSDPVPAERLKANGLLCVLTNAGRMAVVTIEDPYVLVDHQWNVRFKVDLYAAS